MYVAFLLHSSFWLHFLQYYMPPSCLHSFLFFVLGSYSSSKLLTPAFRSKSHYMYYFTRHHKKFLGHTLETEFDSSFHSPFSFIIFSETISEKPNLTTTYVYSHFLAFYFQKVFGSYTHSSKKSISILQDKHSLKTHFDNDMQCSLKEFQKLSNLYKHSSKSPL